MSAPVLTRTPRTQLQAIEGIAWWNAGRVLSAVLIFFFFSRIVRNHLYKLCEPSTEVYRLNLAQGHSLKTRAQFANSDTEIFNITEQAHKTLLNTVSRSLNHAEKLKIVQP